MFATIPAFGPLTLRIPLPDFLPFAEIPIHSFGVLIAIGFVVGAYIAKGRARRLGLDPEIVDRIVPHLVFAMFLGGHVGYGLMYKPTEYFADPIKFLYVWEGLSSVGGIFACLVALALFFRREGIAPWGYLDCLAHGFTVGFFFGRMGCFTVHDHPGTESTFFLAVDGICATTADPSVACHDMGLYEALWSISLYGLFVFMDRTPRVVGTYALGFFIAYAPVRIFMDFFRPLSTDVRYGFFTPAQYFVVFFFCVSVFWLYRRHQANDPYVWALRHPPKD